MEGRASCGGTRKFLWTLWMGLSALGATYAQEPAAECEASNLSLDGGLTYYACQKYLDPEGRPDLKLDWTSNPEQGTVSIAISQRTDGYLSIAFPSSAGRMVPADAVIGACSPTGGSLPVEPYAIQGFLPRSIRVDGGQTISNAGCKYTDGITTVYFTRPYDNGGDFPIRTDGETAINWAYGGSSSLSYHGSNAGDDYIDFLA